MARKTLNISLLPVKTLFISQFVTFTKRVNLFLYFGFMCEEEQLDFQLYYFYIHL